MACQVKADEWWPQPVQIPSRGSARHSFLQGFIKPLCNIADAEGARLLRGRAGLGYTDPQSPSTFRALNPAGLDGQAHSSDKVMAVVWNAGYLDRIARNDGLVDFLTGNFHICLTQANLLRKLV